MPLPTRTLGYYYDRVQREAGWQVLPFPTVGTPTDLQQRVIDRINETLRYFNERYWLNFQETEFIFTTVPGQRDYDLSLPPYSQVFWRMSRVGRNACIRLFDDIPLQYVEYTEIDLFRPDLTKNAKPIYYTGFGLFLRLWPPPDGTQIKHRYYPTAIGTDSTGTVLKNAMTLIDDLPTMNDEWEDAIVWNAVVRLRMTDKADTKTQLFVEQAGRWEAILADKMKPGRDCQTQIYIPANSKMSYLKNKVFPFLTPLQF